MILGIVEQNGDTLVEASLEMLTLARGLAEKREVRLEAVLFGEGARDTARDVQAYGVTRAHVVGDERLRAYGPSGWGATVAQVTESLSPQAVLAAGTDRGSEVMADAAGRLELPLAAQCTEIHPEGDLHRFKRVRWGGSLLEHGELDGNPALFTVAPHAVQAQEAPASDLSVEEFDPALEEGDLLAQLSEWIESQQEGVPLDEARVVVGGGRGVGGPEGFEMLAELADLLGGAVGGSRVATNNGWRPHSDQIGQTGVQIAPDVYIACGISGAIQHMVGVKGAKRILAINTDREAPIVSRADYAIIGDLNEVVPALIDAIKQEKGG